MIAGVGILGGIGFTMSILISGLAFPTAQFEVLAAKPLFSPVRSPQPCSA